MRHLRHLPAREGEKIPGRIASPRILVGALVSSALAYAWWATGTACPFALVTGIPCPGCGLGRALIALVAGHPADAFRFHPLVFIVVPAMFVFTLGPAAPPRRAPARARAVSPLASQDLGTIAAAALLFAVLGVWIARFGGAFGGPVPVRSAWTVTR